MRRAWPPRWRAALVWSLLVLQAVSSSPLGPAPRPFRMARQAQQNVLLQPSIEEQEKLTEELFGGDLPDRGLRDKRSARFLMNLLFWKINALLALKTRLLFNASGPQLIGASGRLSASSLANGSSGSSGSSSGGTTAAPGVAAEEEVPDFDSNRVMLDIPGELFGTAFSVVTDVSKIVGDVILNTARRTEQFIKDIKLAISRGVSSKISAITRASTAPFRASAAASGSLSSSSSSSSSNWSSGGAEPRPSGPEPVEPEDVELSPADDDENSDG